MWKRKFYNIIIISANVDKGGAGDKTLIHKIWIKRRVFFNPSLTAKPPPQGMFLLSPVDGMDPYGLVPVYCITPGELLNFR